MTDPKDGAEQKPSAGEVLISGLDTGPSEAERENRSPTVKLMNLQRDQATEPDDEDG